jgi:hypothetical protein
VSRWPVVVSVAIIAVVTLVPVSSGGGGPALCLLCGQRGLADFILNVGLFMPFGAALGRRWSLLRVIIAGALFSAGIELAQIEVVSGRDSNVSDLLANTLGAGAGWVALRGWRHVTGRIRPPVRYLVGAVSIPVLLLLAGSALQRPALPQSTYYTQWTARFGHMQPYEGRVLASRVGNLNLAGPPWRITESDSVRTLLLAGADVEVIAIVGPTPDGLAPLFSIYDGEQREVLLVGVDGFDLVYRYRSAAQAMRLAGGDVRVTDAFQGVAAGESVRVLLTPTEARSCVRVGDRETCGHGLTIGTTWMLLYYLPGLPAPGRRILGAVWLALLFLPAGFLLSRSRQIATVGGPGIAVLWVAPRFLGGVITPWSELLAIVAGLAVGRGLGRWLRPNSHGRATPDTAAMPVDTTVRRDSLPS